MEGAGGLPRIMDSERNTVLVLVWFLPAPSHCCSNHVVWSGTVFAELPADGAWVQRPAAVVPFPTGWGRYCLPGLG